MTMKAPLQNMRVVDLGMYVAGPYASVPMADLGADVIKIEPLTGDPQRNLWRPFACCNRGKRSILLDLKQPEGIGIARKICLSADVVSHNFRPGVAERLGLGHDDLKEGNPGLTYMESSAYGDTGPMSKLPGFDMIIQAMCGLESHCGGEDNDPLWLRWAPVDFTGGYLGTIGMLAGHFRRLRSGGGGRLCVNLLDSGLMLNSELLQNSDQSFDGATTINSTLTGNHPAQSIYQAKDGWVAIVARSADQQRALQRTLDLTADFSHDDLAGAAARHDTGELLSLLHEAGVWAERCRDDFEAILFNSDAWEQAGLLRDHPNGPWGVTRQIGNCLRFSDMEPDRERAGRVPEAGEDTREILAEFGYDEAHIDDLYVRNIVA